LAPWLFHKLPPGLSLGGDTHYTFDEEAVNRVERLAGEPVAM